MEKWALMEVMRNHEGIFENVSDKIWEFAEIRYHEFQSADLLCQTLKEAGFQVTRPIAGIETAFVGEFGSGKPVIGFLGEFDALPNLSQKADLTRKEAIKEDACGHGCGHNLLGVGSLEAACAVKKMIEAGRFHGTVRYYGCPAEESGAGKGFMVRAGVFHDVDICLTWHPTDQNGVMQNALANMRMFFEFHGISAHAGAKPYMGRSALDAVELTNVGCNYLREHIIPEARLHYAVTNTGGTAPNIVQAYAEEIYCIRAPKLDQLEEIFGRVCNVARGSALMTDTRLNSISCGCFIFPTASLKKVNPTCNTKNATTKAAIYSILPCPNGCSLSAGLLAILTPIKLMIDEPASDKLLNASAITEILCIIIPIVIFIKNNKTLQKMPTILARIP